MRIIQVGPFPVDKDHIKGGVEASVYGISKELSKTNDILIIDIPRVDSTDYMDVVEGMYVLRLSAVSGSNYQQIFRVFYIFEIIKNYHCDICHIHASSALNLLLCILLRLGHVRYIFTIHGLAHKEAKNKFKKNKTINYFFKYIYLSLVEFSIISISKYIVVNTQYVANVIRHYMKSRKILQIPSIYIIPQGVDSDYYKLDSDPERNNFLSVGAFTERKGHHHLVEAMCKLKDYLPKFKLNIVGSITDVEYFNMLTYLIDKYKLSNNIKIYSNVSKTEMLEFYSKAEIFLLHSEEESQGIVFCEALASGIPIVATNVSAIPDVVEQYVNGLLCEFSDTNEFAKNILMLCGDRFLMEKCIRSNKEKANKYKWETVGESINKLYASTLI